MAAADRPKSLLCPKCGYLNTESDSYCYRCGEYLEDDFEAAKKGAFRSNEPRPATAGEKIVAAAMLIFIIGFLAYVGYLCTVAFVDFVIPDSAPQHTGYFDVTVNRGDSTASTVDFYFDGSYNTTMDLGSTGCTSNWTQTWRSDSSTCKITIRVVSGDCTDTRTFTVIEGATTLVELTLRR